MSYVITSHTYHILLTRFFDVKSFYNRQFVRDGNSLNEISNSPISNLECCEEISYMRNTRVYVLGWYV